MRAAVIPRATTPETSSSTHSRRAFTASVVGAVIAAPRKRASADVADDTVFADAPPSPALGACADCIGEYNGYLNSCDRAQTSCVSSQNDDAAHFSAPWAYEGGRVDAMRTLVGVATGDIAARGRAGEEVMQSRGRGARAEGGRARVVSKKVLSFVSRVQEYDEERGYVRLVLAPRGGGSDETLAEDDDRLGGVFDAEFLFIDNDEVVNVRVAQRGEDVKRGTFRLSYTDLVAFDTNLARARAEELRIAIGWELLPVIAAFDPKWSDKETLWFERLFNLASGRASPEYDLNDMRDAMSYD